MRTAPSGTSRPARSGLCLFCFCVCIEVVFVSLSEERLAESPVFVQLCVIYGASILGDQTDSVSRCLMAAVKKALKVFEQLQYAHGDPVRRRFIAATLA